MTPESEKTDDAELVRSRIAQRPVVLVGGPTASGKSGLAADVAAAFNGVVINADSMQVYRELDIITARPGAEDLAKAPHRLYGVLSGAERCSAARWREMALAEIEAAFAKEQLPILVGGTGLYLRTLEEGLAPVPEIPDTVRRDTWAHFDAVGPERFHRELAQRDPEMAARLNIGDTQRLLRAWEVFEATGMSLADWQARQSESTEALDPRLSLLKLAVVPPREAVYARCDARFEAMAAQGAIEEVKALLEMRLDPTLPVMKSHWRSRVCGLSGGRDTPGSRGFQGSARDTALCEAANDLAQESVCFAKRHQNAIFGKFKGENI